MGGVKSNRVIPVQFVTAAVSNTKLKLSMV